MDCLNSAVERIGLDQYPCIFSQTEIGRQIGEMYNISPHRAEGFAYYLLEKPGYGTISYGCFNDKEYAKGVFNAFVFKNPDVLKTLTEGEKQARINSIIDLHEMVNRSIGELTGEMNRIREVSNLEADKIQELRNSFNSEKNKFIMEKNKFIRENEEFAKENEKLLKYGKQRISDLEELYEENLRFSAPANYWKNFRRNYWITGALIFTFYFNLRMRRKLS